MKEMRWLKCGRLMTSCSEGGEATGKDIRQNEADQKEWKLPITYFKYT